MRWTGMLLSIGVIGVLLVSVGCQPWKDKYEACNLELQNLEGRFEGAVQAAQDCEAKRDELMRQLKATEDDLASARTSSKRSKTNLEKEGGVYDPGRGTITVTLMNDVLFSSGQAKLKSSPKARLSRIADIIQRDHANKEVWVVGHTDTDPIKKSKWKDNWQLSTERALAVVRHLTRNGISPKKIVAAGRGEYRPISKSKTQNRRVEIIVFTR